MWNINVIFVPVLCSNEQNLTDYGLEQLETQRVAPQLHMLTCVISAPTQLDAAASQLNSNDAFVLVTPGGTFQWVGVGASDTEKQGAQQLCGILGVSASELSEGGESGEEMWWRLNNNFSFSVQTETRLAVNILTVVFVLDTNQLLKEGSLMWSWMVVFSVLQLK